MFSYMLEKFATDMCGWWVGMQGLLELLLKSKTSKPGTARLLEYKWEYALQKCGDRPSRQARQQCMRDSTHHKHVLELCDFLWPRSNGVGNHHQLFDLHNCVGHRHLLHGKEEGRGGDRNGCSLCTFVCVSISASSPFDSPSLSLCLSVSLSVSFSLCLSLFLISLLSLSVVCSRQPHLQNSHRIFHHRRPCPQ